MEGDPS